jgi:homoserine kinase
VRRATAFAPATVANVAVGFDILGFAVEGAGDEVTVTVTQTPGARIRDISDATGTLAAGDIPSDPARNTATVGLIKLLEDLRPGHGFEVSVRKGIALGSGMGGSAASAVASLVAANALLERPLGRADLLKYAVAAEAAASGTPHPDNVTPCLFGGLTLAVSNEPLRHVRLPVPPGVLTVLVHPRIRLDTRDARRVLRPDVPLAAHVRQSALLGGFVAGCYTNDLDLIRHSLKDVVIEPQRAALIPGFARVQAAALACGALGASISGSGPSLFAWVASESEAAAARAAMVEAFRAAGVGEVDSWVSPVSQDGARVIG